MAQRAKIFKITDRKKELLKTSGGKYVAPAPIENKMKEDFLVEQIMVVGEKKKFVSALIVPAPEALKDWCDEECIEWSDLSQMVQHPKVISKYQEVIDNFNPEFSHIEQIKNLLSRIVPGIPLKRMFCGRIDSDNETKEKSDT